MLEAVKATAGTLVCIPAAEYNSDCCHKVPCRRYGSFCCVHAAKMLCQASSSIATKFNGRLVAVRMPKPWSFQDCDESLKKIHQEAFVMQMKVERCLIGQPFVNNILAVHSPSLLTVGEWCDGVPLDTCLRDCSLTALQRMNLIVQLLDALYILRYKRVVHCDIKVTGNNCVLLNACLQHLPLLFVFRAITSSFFVTKKAA